MCGIKPHIYMSTWSAVRDPENRSQAHQVAANPIDCSKPSCRVLCPRIKQHLVQAQFCIPKGASLRMVMVVEHQRVALPRCHRREARGAWNSMFNLLKLPFLVQTKVITIYKHGCLVQQTLYIYIYIYINQQKQQPLWVLHCSAGASEWTQRRLLLLPLPLHGAIHHAPAISFRRRLEEPQPASKPNASAPTAAVFVRPRKSGCENEGSMGTK